MISLDNEFRRCKVFHVLPLTYSLAIFKISFHTAAFILICTLLIKPNLIEDQKIHSKVFGCLCKNKLDKNHHELINKIEIVKNGDKGDVIVKLDVKKEYLNDFNKIRSNDEGIRLISVLRENRVTQLYWALLLTAIYLSFSLMLLHGIHMKNASNMLPFFCLQVFDLILNILWLFDHLLSSKNMQELQSEFKCLPVSKYFNFLSPTISCAIILMFCVIFIMVQFYFMCVVWSCYRFIIISRQELPIHRIKAYKNGNLGLYLWRIISLTKDKNRIKIKELEGINEELPKYEEILKIPNNAYNPPPYIGKNEKDDKQ